MATTRFEKVSEVVARQILDDIVERRMTPGTRLPAESVMLSQLRVGRGSLREALRILEVLGLVRVKAGPQGGPVVNEVTSREFGRTSSFFYHARDARFKDLLEARLLIEPTMARMAAARLTNAGKKRLTDNLSRARDLVDKAGPDWGEASSEFHGLIAGMSGNPILDLFGSSLNDIHTERVSSVFPVGERTVVLDVHERIAQAILAKDGDEAERLARRHMEELSKRIQRLGSGQIEGPLGWR